MAPYKVFLACDSCFGTHSEKDNAKRSETAVLIVKPASVYQPVG